MAATCEIYSLINPPLMCHSTSKRNKDCHDFKTLCVCPGCDRFEYTLPEVTFTSEPLTMFNILSYFETTVMSYHPSVAVLRQF